MSNLVSSLSGTSLADTEARIGWLESRWSLLRIDERSYSLVDIAMRLGRLTATTSNYAALSMLVARFRELESSMMANLARVK